MGRREREEEGEGGGGRGIRLEEMKEKVIKTCFTIMALKRRREKGGREKVLHALFLLSRSLGQ